MPNLNLTEPYTPLLTSVDTAVENNSQLDGTPVYSLAERMKGDEQGFDILTNQREVLIGISV